jgi:hypothetical protein
MENSISVPQIHQVQICKAMQKLKFEPVNGYGVLVDETGKSKSDWFLENGELSRYWSHTSWVFADAPKIIFAEPELNLEGVPIFEWRDFEMKKKSLIECENTFSTQLAMDWWIKGYKSNPAKYTEPDLSKAISLYMEGKSFSEIKESLERYPKYIVMDNSNIQEIIW